MVKLYECSEETEEYGTRYFNCVDQNKYTELRALCDEFNKACKYAFNSLESRKTLPGTALCMSDVIEKYEKWRKGNEHD